MSFTDGIGDIGDWNRAAFKDLRAYRDLVFLMLRIEHEWDGLVADREELEAMKADIESGYRERMFPAATAQRLARLMSNCCE